MLVEGRYDGSCQDKQGELSFPRYTHFNSNQSVNLTFVLLVQLLESKFILPSLCYLCRGTR